MTDPLYHEADEVPNTIEGIGPVQLFDLSWISATFNSWVDESRVPKEVMDFSDQIYANASVCKHCGCVYVRLQRRVDPENYLNKDLSWQPHECPARLLKRLMEAQNG